MAELRRVAGEAQMRGEKAPAFGDLLYKAWLDASSKPVRHLDPPSIASDVHLTWNLSAMDADDLRSIAIIFRENLQGAAFTAFRSTMRLAIDELDRLRDGYRASNGQKVVAQNDTESIPISDDYPSRVLNDTLYPQMAKDSKHEPGDESWEHEYLEDILESEHKVAKTAIRENLVAFRELATGEPASDPASDRNARSEPLPDREMERISEELGTTERLNERAEAAHPKHKTSGKRRKPPAGRTGSGD